MNRNDKPLGKLWLHTGVAAALAAEADAAGPNETGGMLLGWASDEDIVVVGATGPGPNARHDPYEMRPDSRWQKEQLAAEYHRSGRTITYVGDWHSHPHGLPLPSEQDYETALRVARTPAARTEAPLTLIIGVDEAQWLIAPFRLRDQKFELLGTTPFDGEEEARLYGVGAPGDLIAALTARLRRAAPDSHVTRS